MKKSLFFLTSLLFLFSSTPAFAYYINYPIAVGIFFIWGLGISSILPSIVGLIIFHTHKQRKKTISLYQLVDRSYSISSLILLIPITVILFLEGPFSSILFTFILYMLTNAFYLPPDTKLNPKLAKLIHISRLFNQILALLLFSTIIALGLPLCSCG